MAAKAARYSQGTRVLPFTFIQSIMPPQLHLLPQY